MSPLHLCRWNLTHPHLLRGHRRFSALVVNLWVFLAETRCEGAVTTIKDDLCYSCWGRTVKPRTNLKSSGHLSSMSSSFATRHGHAISARFIPGANAGCENEKWSFLLALVYRLLTIVILTHVKRILRLLRESIVPIHNLSHDLMRVNSMMWMYCYFNERCLPSALSPYLCKAMSEETIGDKCSW